MTQNTSENLPQPQPGTAARPAEPTTSPTPPAPPSPPSDSVTLTIDGQTITAKKGTLLVEAAKQVGMEIPVFCYHPKMKPVGACRMCLVQIEKLPRLQTACTTPVAADMVVSTRSKEVVDAQNGVIELLLANHPLDCPICDKGGECPLQDNTFTYGPGASRFTEEKRHQEKAYPLGPRIVLDRERCIMCFRCVRFHQEIAGDEQLAALDRGAYSEIGTLPGESYDSIFSGNTVELCPVGALTSRQYRFRARPWDLVRTASVCSGCAVGCNIQVHSRAESVLRLVSRENRAVDDGWLCDRGRFDSVPATRAERPEHPLLRGQGTAGGELAEAAWDAALEWVGERLRSGRAGVLLSQSLSNEAVWALSQTLRPLLPADSVAVWPPLRLAWPVQGAIANLAGCRAIVTVGLDVWNDLPVLALWVRRAIEAGAVHVHIGANNGLFRDSTHWLKVAPGAEAEAATALVDAVYGRKATALAGLAQNEYDLAAATLKAATGESKAAALLALPAVLDQPNARGTLEDLARVIGAQGETGLVGAPDMGANARGYQDLAPDLAGTDSSALLARLNQAGDVVLAIGDEAWGELEVGAARLALATSRPLGEDPRVDAVLPLAHAYERQGSVTNLEGRVQYQEGGATPPEQARPDWSVAAELARRMGGTTLRSLTEIRAAIVALNPSIRMDLEPAELRPFTSTLSIGVSQGDLGHTGRATPRQGPTPHD